MIRAPMGDRKYWDDRVTNRNKSINMAVEQIQMPSKNPEYRPQYVFDLANDYTRLIVTRYSLGDAIPTLSEHFAGLLDAWELSNKLAVELSAKLQPGEGFPQWRLLSADVRDHRDPRTWIFRLSRLNHYNWCFWLVGLALALEIPDELWQRLLVLIGGEGEDVLLDRVIASRQPNRKLGDKLLHKKPYVRLLKAIEAQDKGLPQDKQAELLRDFVEHWYIELERKGSNELWWYIYGDAVRNPLEMGSYFGRWCIEALAAVKAFGLDDSLCLGHEHYPGDLLRPDGPSTHPVREEPKASWLKKLFGKGGVNPR